MAEMTIWKYGLDIKDGVQRIDMPKDARVISVHMQHGLLTIWAIVDPLAEPTQRYFSIKGTGWLMDGVAVGGYLGSAHTPSFVWHVFETGPL